MTSMETSFDHLYIMNSVLSLAYNFESYPNHLFKAGYKISRIEPNFKIMRNLNVNPDIIFMSTNNCLIAECKSGGGFIGGRIKHYNEISIKHLAEKGIDVPSENLELDVAIFGNNHLQVLKGKLIEEGIRYPQVKIDNTIKKVSGNDFKDPRLQSLFKSASEISGEPLVILKFDEHSSLRQIAPYIFQELMARSISGDLTFTTRQFTEELFKETWNNLDKTFQKSLNNKVKSILNRCRQLGLSQYLSKSDDTWTIKVNSHWKSRKKFNNDFHRFVSNLDQKQLQDFI